MISKCKDNIHLNPAQTAQVQLEALTASNSKHDLQVRVIAIQRLGRERDGTGAVKQTSDNKTP